MFNFFNKNNKKNNEIIENKEIVFPSAKETLQNTYNNWPTLDSQTILKKIISRSNQGERYAFFSSAYISEQARIELIKQGYKVKTSMFNGKPTFEISW